MQQLSITSFIPPPSVSRAPPWSFHAGGGSLSFSENLFRRSSLNFRTDAAVYRIHAAAICGELNNNSKRRNCLGNSSNKGAAGLRRSRGIPGNEENENVEESHQLNFADEGENGDAAPGSRFLDNDDDEKESTTVNTNKMHVMTSIPPSSASRYGSDGVPRQMSSLYSPEAAATFVMSVAPESVRLYRFSDYDDDSESGEHGEETSSASSVITECLPFRGKRWGLGALSSSSPMIALNSRGTVGLHITSLEEFASRAFYRQEREHDEAARTSSSSSSSVGGGGGGGFFDEDENGSGENAFSSFYCSSERHSSRKQNTLTSVMWVPSQPALVAATTSLTRSVLLWDIRRNNRSGPVAEWSAQGKPKQAQMVASFASDSDPSYPVAMATTTIAGAGAAPAAFVCADSSLKLRTWDLRVSSSQQQQQQQSPYAPTAVGKEINLHEALRHALRSNLPDGDSSSIGTICSIVPDPLQSRCVWVNTSGGFLGRVDMMHSASSGEASAGAVSHAMYSDDSMRDATTTGLPTTAPKMAVLPPRNRAPVATEAAVVACPRFSTRSVCVLAATDLRTENGEGSAVMMSSHEQQQRRWSAFSCSYPPRRQRHFSLYPLTEDGGGEEGSVVADLSAAADPVPLHCSLVDRGGCDEILFVEDQARRLWFRSLV